MKLVTHIKRIFAIGLTSFIFLFSYNLQAADSDMNFSAITAEIITNGNSAIAKYQPSINGDDTAMVFSDIYFDQFEESGMEVAIGLRDPNLKAQLESLFGAIIGLARKNAEKQKVEKAWRNLADQLQETAENYEAKAGENNGMWVAVLQSFLILLREGFEALLVVTALVTYLRRTAPEKVGVIWHGTVWALVASVVTAISIGALFEVAGPIREALEGFTMLLASAVLFYVSYWLISKREANRWQSYVQGQIDKAVSGGRLFALGFAAFLAVYREGAETVLFYQAMLAGSGDNKIAIFIGFSAASATLILLYFVMRSASLKLPMRLFFSITAALLYYLAIVFAGTGVLELQEAGLISITPLDNFPRVTWLGLFPTMESVAAQIIVLAPLPFATMYWMRKNIGTFQSEGRKA